MKKLLIKSFIISVSFLFLGCFEIFHYLEKSAGNSVKVVWSFSISSDFSDSNKQLALPGQKQEKLDERISKSEKEIEEKLKGIVRDLKVSEIENEFEKGIKIEYLIKDIQKARPLTDSEEGFPLIPSFEKDNNQLIFTFLPADHKNENKPAPKEDHIYPKKDADDRFEEISDRENNMDPGFEKIATQIMSLATYKLMLGKGFVPKRVTVRGKTSGESHELPFTKLGDIYMIKIPFMSFLLKEKAGFDLVVQL